MASKIVKSLRGNLNKEGKVFHNGEFEVLKELKKTVEDKKTFQAHGLIQLIL